MLVFGAFWVLVLATLARADGRAALEARTREEWLIDGPGLLVQGAIIPLLELVAIFFALDALWPDARASIEIPPAAAFLLNFVLVDYLYYWNHRLLHSRLLWPLHLVHHTVRALDVVSTSRNTLWSSFFILYVWVNGAWLFLLADPAPYALAAALTASLDLWRHSTITPRVGSLADRALSTVLITPGHHALHHAADGGTVNFGANLNLWDRLHGTYQRPAEELPPLGVWTALDLTRKLLWPFPARHRGWR